MKLNGNLPIIVYDYETTGLNSRRCQLTQIAALVLDSRTLLPRKNGQFNIEVCPIFDEEKCAAAGLDPVEDKALQITGKTVEGLMKAPNEKVAWESFRRFCKMFNPSGDSYRAPIPAGYNINGYDSNITHRLCQKYGPLSKSGEQGLFNTRFRLDVQDIIFSWLEFEDDIKSISLVNMCEYLGIPKALTANAHDAMCDVKNTANILIKFMKFHRTIAAKSTFKDGFKDKEMFIK